MRKRWSTLFLYDSVLVTVRSRAPEVSVRMTAQPYNHERRIDRAHHHLRTLESEVEGWVRREPYTCIDECDVHTGEHVTRIEDIEPAPTEFSLIIGDCLHNLRAALDNLVYELAVKKYGGEPLPSEVEQNVMFPIFLREEGYRSRGTERISAIDERAQTVIEGLQPYHGASDYLWILHELACIDRHRLPHLTLFARQTIGIHGTDIFRIDTSSAYFRPRGPLEDGAELVRYKTLRPGDTIEQDLSFRFTIAFPQVSPARGGEAVQTLKMCMESVQFAAGQLRKFLTSQ